MEAHVLLLLEWDVNVSRLHPLRFRRRLLNSLQAVRQEGQGLEGLQIDPPPCRLTLRTSLFSNALFDMESAAIPLVCGNSPFAILANSSKVYRCYARTLHQGPEGARWLSTQILSELARVNVVPTNRASDHAPPTTLKRRRASGPSYLPSKRTHMSSRLPICLVSKTQ